jgi:hypothetical protein
MSTNNLSDGQADLSADELVDKEQACRVLGGDKKPIHPATLSRGVKTGRYSPPIKIGPQLRRWRLRELQADIARLAAERDQS